MSRMPSDEEHRPIPLLMRAPAGMIGGGNGGAHDSGALAAGGTWINTTAFDIDSWGRGTQAVRIEVSGGIARCRLTDDSGSTGLATDHRYVDGSVEDTPIVTDDGSGNILRYRHLRVYAESDCRVTVSELV